MATKEDIPTFNLKWGQLGLMLLAAAGAAVFEPTWLVYAGVIRFAWCMVGGHAGRGLASLAAFGAVYLVITFGLARPQQARDSATAASAETIVKTDTAAQAPPSSAVLTAANFRSVAR